jgi:ABC-type multidrug transport system permease subunit
MILTILRILYLRLRNNPLELMLVFIMPVVFFSIFAAIFSNGIATGGDQKLRVGWIAERETALGNELLKFLEANSTLLCFPLLTEQSSGQATDARNSDLIDSVKVDSLIAEAQKSGGYDLIIRIPANFSPLLSDRQQANTHNLRLVTDGQNPIAVAMITSVVKGFFAQAKAKLAAKRLLSLHPPSQLASGTHGPGNGKPTTLSLFDPATGTTSLKVSRSVYPEAGSLQILGKEPEVPWVTIGADTMNSMNGISDVVKDGAVFASTPDPPMEDYFDAQLTQNSSDLDDLAEADLAFDGLLSDFASRAPQQSARYFDYTPVTVQTFSNERDSSWLTTDGVELTSMNGVSEALEDRFQELPAKPAQATIDQLDSFPTTPEKYKIEDEVIINVENPQSAVQKNPRIAMYAAGIAVLFLLFSSTGNAAALLEEAESGTLDRILIGKAGLFQIIGGKWLGIFFLGCIQICVMFLWAELIFKIQLWKHLDGFLVMTLSTAAATSSFAMLMATLCRSRAQLNAASVVLILSMSAVGGSMIPRFAMSDRMKEIGKWTFNAWALDGYQKVFWFQSPISSLQNEVIVLLSSAFVFGGLALIFSLRWKRA